MSITVLLSPAKKLNFEAPVPKMSYRAPSLMSKTSELIKTMKTISVAELSKLMHLSLELSSLNHDRYQKFEIKKPENVTMPAAFAFNGEVYAGLDVQSYDQDDLAFADKHVKILSGLYGLLKALDFIQPYRLEMGTKLAIGENKNLYEYWGHDICNEINSSIHKGDVLINLASNEYFKAARAKQIEARIITPVFKDFRKGAYKTVMMYAKKARGEMAKYIVKNKISDPEDLKSYGVNDYVYNEQLSSGDQWVFTR